MKQEARHKFNNQIKDPGRGKHLWMIIGIWRVTNPSTVDDPDGQFILDTENLMTLEGPGCYKCEQPWTPEREKKWCNGLMH